MPPRFRWTVATFYRAVDANVFDNPPGGWDRTKRIELIKGDLWEREHPTPQHANTTARIARRLRAALEPAFRVREEKSLNFADDTEPTCDVCVVGHDAPRYVDRHPTYKDARLVVEVSDITGARDTGEKALLYAQAGIADYWVSLVNERVLLVFRDPTPDGYPEPLRLTENDTVRPLAAPDVEIAVRDLVARAPAVP